MSREQCNHCMSLNFSSTFLFKEIGETETGTEQAKQSFFFCVFCFFDKGKFVPEQQMKKWRKKKGMQRHHSASFCVWRQMRFRSKLLAWRNFLVNWSVCCCCCCSKTKTKKKQWRSFCQNWTITFDFQPQLFFFSFFALQSCQSDDNNNKKNDDEDSNNVQYHNHRERKHHSKVVELW